MFPYTLELTASDMKTIYFIGGRYAWSAALQKLGEGCHRLGESEAWDLRDAFEEDAIGGHSLFPMLGDDSEALRLYDRLTTFMEGIV
jgi:hypothetical protein